jgi:hypothetical protein
MQCRLYDRGYTAVLRKRFGPEVVLGAISTPLGVFQPEFVVHCLAESLLAAETFGGLNRCVSKQELNLLKFSSRFREARLLIVGSEEARLRASLRPPLKLHVRFSRMQLSRRHMT